MDTSAPLDWADIAGLEFAKKTIKEIIILPMLRPLVLDALFYYNSSILLQLHYFTTMAHFRWKIGAAFFSLSLSLWPNCYSPMTLCSLSLPTNREPE